MSYERSQLDDLTAKRNQNRIRERATELRAMALAIAPMENMTGEPAWDYFIKAVQAMIEPDKMELENIRSILTNPLKIDQMELMLCKVRAANLEGRISAFEAVEELPKTVIKQGKLAIESLRQIEET